MQIEISNGELLDKLSILEIKLEKVLDPGKLLNIQKEYRILLDAAKVFISLEYYKVLLEINKELWEVEDRLRELEKEQKFDDSFISYARAVYRLNDRRAFIKKQINIETGSTLVEEKSYASY